MRAMLSILAVAAAAVTFTISAGPALAATSSEVCAKAPAALRSLAEGADREAQRKALRNIELGEVLCEARNRNEAARKFRLAAELLGTDLATALNRAATTASIQ
ncbi:hypothetical protein [Thermaurantiacus sp.]